MVHYLIFLSELLKNIFYLYFDLLLVFLYQFFLYNLKQILNFLNHYFQNETLINFDHLMNKNHLILILIDVLI